MSTFLDYYRVMEAGKQLIVIGSQNAITYREIFPLLKENKLWIGATNNGKDMVFEVPEGADVAPKDREKAAKLGYVGNYTRLGNACWFTNINHGRRHQPLSLMTMADNLKFSKHKQIRENGYVKYDNYDAIEIPFVDAIPSDYKGAMGVPITFMDKYCPEQFEIIWQASGNAYANAPREVLEMLHFDPTIKYGGGLGAAVVAGKAVYSRILIKRKDTI